MYNFIAVWQIIYINMKSNLNMPKHNTKSGFINHCQICGNKDIKTVLDLGYQPLADDLKDTKS